MFVLSVTFITFICPSCKGKKKLKSGESCYECNEMGFIKMPKYLAIREKEISKRKIPS